MTDPGFPVGDGRLLSLAELEEQARALAARPDAELHIQADRRAAYDAVARVLSAAARPRGALTGGRADDRDLSVP